MARFQVSQPAQADLGRILAASAERWGSEGRRRYTALIMAAMRKAAADPHGPLTRDRADLSAGLRSLHLRHARGRDPKTKVSAPVHIVYYQVIRPGLIEIVRIFHERMEPGRHLQSEQAD